jgi:hypothetical protein
MLVVIKCFLLFAYKVISGTGWRDEGLTGKCIKENISLGGKSHLFHLILIIQRSQSCAFYILLLFILKWLACHCHLYFYIHSSLRYVLFLSLHWNFTCVCVCVCVLLVYVLSHSTSPFFVMGFFKIGSRKLFAQAGFESGSSWSLPPE